MRESRARLRLNELSPELQAVYARLAESELRLRDQLFCEIPAQTIGSIPGQASHHVAATVVRRWRRRGHVFAFRYKRRDYFPEFQFDDGMPKPIVGRVLELVRPIDGWEALYWFVAANAWLDGKCPLECLESDPVGVIEAAIHVNDKVSD